MSKQRFRKATSLLLAFALGTLGPLTACNKADENDYESLVPESSYVTAAPETEIQPSYNEIKEVNSLSEIQPKFSVYTLRGKSYIQIDEASVIQIARLVMRDVKEFLIKHGATNMNLDENGNKLSGPENFYAKWQDEYFTAARAYSESSFMIDYVSNVGAAGISQLKEKIVKETLQENFKDVFGVTVDFSDLKITPSQEAIDKIFYSKDAQQEAVEAIYNSLLLSTHYTLYLTRNSGPNHKDYYAKYGGYDENLRRDFVTFLYANNWNESHNDLISGNFYKLHDDDVYLNNVRKYQMQFGQKYEGKDYNPNVVYSQNEAQPGN